MFGRRRISNTARTYYFVPSDNDVMCGRGRIAFKSPGNQSLRALIVAFLGDFIGNSRSGKAFVIQRIVMVVMEKGGRFLKRDKATKKWYDGGMADAKNCVGCAFRDAATPDKVKCIEILKATLRRGTNVENRDRVLTALQSMEEPTETGSLVSSSTSRCGGDVFLVASSLKSNKHDYIQVTEAAAAVAASRKKPIDLPNEALIRQIVFYNATRGSAMGNADSLVRSVSAFDEPFETPRVSTDMVFNNTVVMARKARLSRGYDSANEGSTSETGGHRVDIITHI